MCCVVPVPECSRVLLQCRSVMQQLREFQGNLENIREEIAQEGLASTCRYACRTSVTGGTQAHYAWRGLVVASLVSIIEVNLR